ncbi:hypothetical protein HPB47_013589, partial [Ixodes persulcatus]
LSHEDTETKKKKRKVSESQATSTTKKSKSTQHRDNFRAQHAPDVDMATQDSAPPVETEHSLEFLCHLKTPSKFWSTHHFPVFDGVLYCTSFLAEEASVTSEKVVMFVSDNLPGAYGKVYLRGRLIEESHVESQMDAEHLLEKADSYELCSGALNASDYNASFLTSGLKEKMTVRPEVYLSSSCPRKVENKDEQEYCEHRSSHVSLPQRLMFAGQRNRRLISRMTAMKEEVQKMRTHNASVKEDVLSEYISKLPTKQQESIQEASTGAPSLRVDMKHLSDSGR